jgi:hypothetical protein
MQLIQDADGTVWKYQGDTPPAGCRWMSPNVGTVKIAGEWRGPTGEKRVPCEIYSRVVGYIRPVRQWNVGKRREWADRVTYRVEL